MNLQTMEVSQNLSKSSEKGGSTAAAQWTPMNGIDVKNALPSSFRSSQSTLAAPLATESVKADWTADQQAMMVEHLPTVRYIARRIHDRLPKHVELEELVSAGILGLVDAFSKFDSTKQVQFRSYAQFRIRGAILDSLRSLDWSPRDLRRKGREIEEAIRMVTARQGRLATEPEIAAELQMDLGDYQQLLGELKGLEIGTLQVEHADDSIEEEVAYVAGKPEDDPLFQCMHGEMQQRMADAVAALPERERLVMTLYYYEELTMKEIGVTLGVVESRVSQLHTSAVLHLRSKLASMARSAKPAQKPTVSAFRNSRCAAR
jgi:RNA polymerase sigma factor for flagellar operon FliA